MLRLAIALFAIQAGYHGFTASLPLALARAGVPDPEIGLIVGTAALVQLPAAFVAGALVDRFGGARILVAGAATYLVASGILLWPGVEPGSSALPFVSARFFQGLGVAATLPGALSLVPRIAPADRQTFALAFIGSAHNVTFVILPPVSLAILAAGSLDGVALVAMVLVIVGMVVASTGLSRSRAVESSGESPAAGWPPSQAPLADRRLGFVFRRCWLRPIVVVLLFVSHFGVLTAYFPQHAAAAGVDVGLFFIVDGIATLIVRIAAGRVADRVAPQRLVIAAVAITGVGLGLLLLPLTVEVLVLAGALAGIGGGLVLTPMLVELSRRSTDADRGSAFSLFSAALAGALVLGSVGVAPIVAIGGFAGAIGATTVALVLSAVIAVGDPALRRSAMSAPPRRPRHSRGSGWRR